MTRIVRNTVLAAAFGIGLVAAPRTSMASEPGNNVDPKNGGSIGMFSGMASMYMNQNASTDAAFSWTESISPTSDVDYHVMMCGKSNLVSVRIEMQNPSQGDLDIFVYGMDGALIGSSRGYTAVEELNVAWKNTRAVVMRVEAWSGTGVYGLGITCQ
jgi:hypothetical protein